MKNSKSLTALLSVLALLGLAQLATFAQAQDNSTLGPPLTPNPSNPSKGFGQQELVRACAEAWHRSSASQSCRARSLTEMENGEHCEIHVRCTTSCADDAPWWCALAPPTVNLVYQGDPGGISWLHHCDGSLLLGGC